MYIARVRIQNYRCFRCTNVRFQPGVNVIIGENNSGKTALLRALGLVLGGSNRSTPTVYDFHRSGKRLPKPPSIQVSVTLKSSGEGRDTSDDLALVATWLTKLDAPWEAELTYEFLLPEDEHESFKVRTEATKTEDAYWRVVDGFLPKYVSRVYGGRADAKNRADPEWLAKFDYTYLDAIRDAESQLFKGSNPLLKAMLLEALDWDPKAEQKKPEQEIGSLQSEFHDGSTKLTGRLKKRIATETLFSLITKTGASDGGKPVLSESATEEDLITALRMFIEREGLPAPLPVTHQGLGYNNLVYVSLVLARMLFSTQPSLRGENATIFPVLLIEEPEAHLHPTLQFRLLKHLHERANGGASSAPHRMSRQVFVTTHSTHVTAATPLDSIVCLSDPIVTGRVHVAYPGRVFGEDVEGLASKRYVERFLDATKSTMLFAKGVILVEGISEQLLIPALARHLPDAAGTDPLVDKHVVVVPVGGSTFKHFLPLFGAGTCKKKSKVALRRRVACLVDADPSWRPDGSRQPRRCWPYMDGSPGFREQSGTVGTVQMMCGTCEDAQHFTGSNTLEYDLAEANPGARVFAAGRYEAELVDCANNPAKTIDVLGELAGKSYQDAAWDALSNLDGQEQRTAAFATLYTLSVKGKGEEALRLASILGSERKPEDQGGAETSLEVDSDGDAEAGPFSVPKHIAAAIDWACGIDDQEGSA